MSNHAVGQRDMIYSRAFQALKDELSLKELCDLFDVMDSDPTDGLFEKLARHVEKIRGQVVRT